MTYTNILLTRVLNTLDASTIRRSLAASMASGVIAYKALGAPVRGAWIWDGPWQDCIWWSFLERDDLLAMGGVEVADTTDVQHMAVAHEAQVLGMTMCLREQGHAGPEFAMMARFLFGAERARELDSLVGTGYLFEPDKAREDARAIIGSPARAGELRALTELLEERRGFAADQASTDVWSILERVEAQEGVYSVGDLEDAYWLRGGPGTVRHRAAQARESSGPARSRFRSI